MDKRDKTLFDIIQQNQIVILGTIGSFFIWIVLMIFSLKEAQAVNKNDIQYIKEAVDKIYDKVK